MSEPKQHPLKVQENGEEMTLSLRQMPNPGGTPVLLLHGASANHRTFLNPAADPRTGDPRCLADWLFQRGYEPWLLDWRGNGTIDNRDLHRLREQLDFDHAAMLDIPKALETIASVSRTKMIGAVAHCMGAASLAQSIAEGYVGKHQHLTHVVLLTIGLFYEPALDGRLKIQDHTLDRLWPGGSEDAIDPRPGNTWPQELNEIYQNWPASMRPHEKPESEMHEVCNKVSFMFGQPYRERNLDPEVHRGTFLVEQFGAIPLRMYLQGAQNVRRGWAGKFAAKNDDDSLIDRHARERFGDLDRLSLITGAKNQIWHRDSIDRMHEWLNCSRAARNNSSRDILPEYAHQDLLWGTDAHADVFPKILAGLPPPNGGGTAHRPSPTRRRD